MKEVKFSQIETLDEKMYEIQIEEVELLEEKNEFWCIINACGSNR